MRVQLGFLALGVCLISLPAMATNIVINGGFEAGTTSPWVASGWFLGHNPGAAHSGDYFVDVGCHNVSYLCDLSQTLTTSPGTSYDLSFFLYSDTLSDPGNVELQVLWNGTMVGDILGPNFGYQEYDVTGLNATGASTQLLFRGSNAPGFSGLDDVSVVISTESGAAVPEPATILLLSTGLASALKRRLMKA